MQVWGHRGSRRPGPENTPSAVQAALAAGADGCEVDVRRTADGQLVCTHDPVVGGRPVIGQSERELASAGVYPLVAVLAAAAGSRLVIEVKNVPRQPDYDREASTAQLLVAALQRLIGPATGAGQQVLISSFDAVSLGIAGAAGWPTGLLTPLGVPLSRGGQQAAAMGCLELHAHASMIASGRSVVAVHATGLRLAAWTITRNRQARRLGQLGVDAVICDDPAGVVAAQRDWGNLS